jgi:hypothetical protein
MNGPIADSLRAQRDFALLQLDDLIRRGRQVSDALAADPADAPSLASAHAWQQTCAAAIHQLSGGSKAHWLSRAFSGALLVRSTGGGAVTEAEVREIVGRILDVLEQAASSLVRLDDVAMASSTAPPATRRFEFVHETRLRPVLETAFADSARAFEEGDFTRSLMTSCGILEAIITDALEVHAEPHDQSIAEWSFDERIAAAEKSGLIRAGCARLPAVARAYRVVPESAATVSERDAKLARQVLHVVMRDLDPGR